MKKSLIILSILTLNFCIYSQDYSTGVREDLTRRENQSEINPLPLNKIIGSTGFWTELSPNVPRVAYYGIDFIDSARGWAVGGSGAVIKTTDEGNTWVSIESGRNNTLNNVDTYNGETIIAVGNNGIIIRSTDGGENWNTISSTAISDLWRVEMINDTLGWICGRFYTLLKTTNGGETWVSVQPGFLQDYWSLDFIDELTGYIACGGGNLLKTTNGGAVWEVINIGFNYSLFCVTVVDSNTILTGGSHIIASSYDGGVTWNTNTTVIVDYYSIALNDSLNGIAVSNSGYFRTTDRGLTWTHFDGSNYYWIQFINSKIGYLVGELLIVRRTNDGGLTWQQLIVRENFRDIHFLTEKTGFLLSGILRKTTDGGETWTHVQGAPTGDYIFFKDSLTGFIGGFKSTDGGLNWYQVNAPSNISSIQFLNDSIGWAVSGNSIIKTVDEGENWIIQFVLLTDYFSSIFMLDSMNGWGASRYLVKTTDGGNTWNIDTNIPTIFLLDVFFNDTQNGFIISSNKFYSTSNGGINWILNTNITGFSVYGQFTRRDSLMFISGYKMFSTTDYWKNWTNYPELDGMPITCMDLVSMGVGYAAGDGGLILKYIDSSYIPVELTTFDYEISGTDVILSWTTSSEKNNMGFEIQRKSTDEYKTIGFIQGNGTTTKVSYYSFTDPKIDTGEHTYRLKQIDYNGEYTYSDEIHISILPPAEFLLNQNYPNPFNPSTTISFSLPKAEYVTIKIYNTLGEEIKTLVNSQLDAGEHKISFDASVISSGIYFYKITAGEYTSVKKMQYIK